MKKYLLFILFFICICVFLLPNKPQQYNDCTNLYKTLSKENFGTLDKEKLLYINVGIDYIPYELIQLFEKLTNIKIVVDIFDSNEMLESKLLAGGAQYDIVFPTAWPNFARQIKAGIYRKIDTSKIDYHIFDDYIIHKLSKYNAANEYCVPYQFGISGIGIEEKVIKSLSPNIPLDSLAIIFEPEYAEKISKNRISVYESPDELFPAVLAFLGLDPETENENDIIKAAKHLKKIRKYISKFTSFGFEDLAAGNACVTLGTSGDILNAKLTNKNIKFIIPKEGAPIWVDVAAIPLNAKHINNIYAFFKFLFHPQVIAYATNITLRANAVTASKSFVNPEIANNKDIYPPKAIMEKCFIEKPVNAKISALKNRLLTKIKSMDNNAEL